MAEEKAANPSKQTEVDLYRLFFEETRIGCVIARWEGQYICVNQAFANILGRTVEETLKLGYKDITPKEYASKDANQLAEIERTGFYPWFFKHYIHKDGSLVRIRLCLSRVYIGEERHLLSLVEQVKPNRDSFEISEDELPADQLSRWPISIDFAFAPEETERLDKMGRSRGETIRESLAILAALQKHAEDGFTEVVVQEPKSGRQRLLKIDPLAGRKARK